MQAVQDAVQLEAREELEKSMMSRSTNAGLAGSLTFGTSHRSTEGDDDGASTGVDISSGNGGGGAAHGRHGSGGNGGGGTGA